MEMKCGHKSMNCSYGNRKCGHRSRNCGYGNRKYGHRSRDCGYENRKCGHGNMKCGCTVRTLTKSDHPFNLIFRKLTAQLQDQLVHTLQPHKQNIQLLAPDTSSPQLTTFQTKRLELPGLTGFHSTTPHNIKSSNILGVLVLCVVSLKFFIFSLCLLQCQSASEFMPHLIILTTLGNTAE